MSFEVVKYLYKEQRRFYERKKLYMHQAFNKDLVEGFSRSRRLLDTPGTNFDPQPFRYRCQATEDGFIIVFEKLEDAKLYSRIVKFRGFTESYESDWELKTGWEYPLDDFKLTRSRFAKRQIH